TGLVGVIALARSGSLLFYRSHASAGPGALTPPSNAALAPVAGLPLLLIGLVVWAGPLSEASAAIAAQLLDPQQYIEAVLGREQ
ncbi:MAG: monovalent cation/H+ antiporter subunit D, partial [Burkholderiaceae bacterium]|nr:monovalent cation/H+ antiporter subunit D [Burkholderiaceae bacterium]